MEIYAFIVHCLCLPTLLCISVYFASQAEEVLSNAEAYDESHTNHELTSQSPSDVYDKSQDEESLISIPLQVPPLVHSASSPLPRTWNKDGPLVVLTSHTSVFQPTRGSGGSALESSWSICITDHWCKQWRIIASVAFTILVGSLALIQMPGTNGDPLTRCFVYLFILRLVSALLSAGVLLYYFGKNHFRSGNFAMIWCQNVKHNRQSCFYMPWIILALPTIAISWGGIFMLAAVFLSLWGNGLYPNLSPVEEVSPLTIMSLRIIITAMSVVDVGWVWWLVARLRAFDKAVKAPVPAAT